MIKFTWNFCLLLAHPFSNFLQKDAQRRTVMAKWYSVPVAQGA